MNQRLSIFSNSRNIWISMCMERHLTEQEIAQYVDAIEAETANQLPENILAHVEECLECKIEIVEVRELMRLASFKTN